MHTSRVPAALLDPARFDSDYYRPQHLEDERLLRSLNSVQLRETGRFFAGPFGSKLPSSLYLEAGIPLFRVGNVGSMEVNLQNMAHLDPAVHAELKPSEVHSGDLLIVKASVGEKICRVPASMPIANVTQHIIAIRPNGKHDMDYIAAFLFGQYGRRQLERRSLGSIIQYLGVQDARTVLFLNIHEKAQAYIGDKVRQAERLRERACKLLKQARCLVDGLLAGEISEQVLTAALRDAAAKEQIDIDPITHHCLLRDPAKQRPPSQRRYSRVPATALIDRINAEAYSPVILANAEWIAACPMAKIKLGGAVRSPINNSIRNISDQYQKTGGTIPMFRPADINGVWLNPDTAPRLTTEFEADHQKARVYPGDIVLSAAGTIATVGRVPSTVAYGNVNGSCARIAPIKGGEGYLLMYLSSEMARLALTRLAVGSVQKHINLEDLPTLDVVWPNETIREFIGRQISRAESYHLLGQSLPSCAKVLVEAVIEGKVTEAELKDAHEALQRGDTGPDREILDKLQLIPSLDDLYEALDESADASVTVEARG